MKIADIKPGQTQRKIKLVVYADENLVMGAMPSFLATDYMQIENLKTKETAYLLFKDGILIDIQTELNKIADLEKANKYIDTMLDECFYYMN